MPELTIRQMYDASVHFGHQTRFWNPKMSPYIYGKRNRVHIINLDRTLPLLNEAMQFLKGVAADGGKVLFVGTKRAAQKAIKKHAERCSMPYVDRRWLGGTMTNFKTIRLSVKRYLELEELYEKTAFSDLGKKRALLKKRELNKLRRALHGIKDMSRLPDALFVVDVRYEMIAIQEAAKFSIPAVAVVDTNNSLQDVAYPIPGNDDAVSAVELYTSAVADAILEGIEQRVEEQGEYIEEVENDDGQSPESEVKIKVKKSITPTAAASTEKSTASEPGDRS